MQLPLFHISTSSSYLTFNPKSHPHSQYTQNFRPQTPFVTCKIPTNPSNKSLILTLSPPAPLSPLPLPHPPPSLEPERLSNPKKRIHPLNLLQKVAASALNKLEDSILFPFERNHVLPKTLDPAVQTLGNFAPVQECPVRHGLEVVGRIPESLRGIYLRNGANPLHAPTGGYHLFDGDGMIHAVSLEAGSRASYSCRYTRTSRLEQEAELGEVCFPQGNR